MYIYILYYIYIHTYIHILCIYTLHTHDESRPFFFKIDTETRKTSVELFSGASVVDFAR